MDAVVQSTDKNFLVPVGGAVVVSCASDKTPLTDRVRKAYPGRASIAPSLDVLITLLALGESGWRAKLAEREENFEYMKQCLTITAGKVGERLLATPGNPISMAVTLSKLQGDLRLIAGESGDDANDDSNEKEKQRETSVSFFGSMLFSRAVSGTRVVVPGKTQEVGGHTFVGFGASCDNYPVPYFTAAAALGVTRSDVDVFCARLEKVFAEFRKKATKDPGRRKLETEPSATDAETPPV